MLQAVGVAYVWVRLVGVGTHLDLEESEVVAFKNGPWTFLCGMQRKSHISYTLTAKFQEKGSQGWEVISVGQVMVIQALESAFSPQHSCKKKKKSQMRHCASVTPVVKGAGWNRRISRQAGQPSQPVSEL